MASVALVMSLVVPQIGNWWYALTLLAPGAWFYYLGKGTRQEEVRAGVNTLSCPSLFQRGMRVASSLLWLFTAFAWSSCSLSMHSLGSNMADQIVGLGPYILRRTLKGCGGPRAINLMNVPGLSHITYNRVQRLPTIASVVAMSVALS